MGDASGYPETYQDAIAILYEFLVERGAPNLLADGRQRATILKPVAVDDNGLFLGLALDNDNESELTDDRVAFG